MNNDVRNGDLRERERGVIGFKQLTSFEGNLD